MLNIKWNTTMHMDNVMCQPTCIYHQKNYKFLTFGMQKLAPKKFAHSLTSILWTLTYNVTCEEKNHMSIDTLESEMTRTTILPL